MKFEDLCLMLLDDSRCHGALPEMDAGMENMFYEKYGMSAEDIQSAFCKGERVL